MGGSDDGRLSRDSVRRWAAAAVLAWSSSIGCSATAPEAVPVSLSILPATEALRVGESVALRGAITYKDGHQEDAAGIWSVNGAAVTMSQPGPTVTGGSEGTAVVSLTAQGLSVSRQLTVVLDVRGVWVGILHHDTCTRLVGEGPSLCGKSPNGIDYSFEVNFGDQTGAVVLGEATVAQQSTGVLPGRMDVGGLLSLADSQMVAHYDVGPYIYRLLGWRSLSISSQSSVTKMSGTGTLEHDFVNAWGHQLYRMPAVLNLERR